MATRPELGRRCLGRGGSVTPQKRFHGFRLVQPQEVWCGHYGAAARDPTREDLTRR
jgi:hypothetical protein